jgi:protein TonB
MFEQMLLPAGGTHQGRNTVFALVGELGVLAFATAAMVYFQVLPLPLPQPAVPLYFSPPAPPPPAAATRAPVREAKIVQRKFNIPVLAAPITIPKHAAMIAEAPPMPDLTSSAVTAGEVGGVVGGVPGGVLGGSLNGLLGAPPAPVVAAAPKPKAPEAPPAPSQIRVGGEVQAALLTHEVVPAYPVIARDARIQGMVRLSAAIAPNGRVTDLQVLSGNPLLTEAAQRAVKQWTYRPTYLNGKPVEVLTEIDVKFTLG